MANPQALGIPPFAKALNARQEVEDGQELCKTPCQQAFIVRGDWGEACTTQDRCLKTDSNREQDL